MPHRPQYHPHDQGASGNRPVPPHPLNPWDFFATRKPALSLGAITKRELFAAMAMLILRADDDDTEHDIAKAAVMHADALIAELSKPTE